MDIYEARVPILRLSGILFIFLAVFVRPAWHTESTAAFAVELAGYVFLIAGLMIRMWSALYLGGRKSQQLVTEGPYSICRNPLYLGTLLLIIGAGLCFENVLMLAAMVIVFVPVHLIAVRWEERRLEARFPVEYALYKKTVPRFLPVFRNYKPKEELMVPFRSVRRVMVDTVGVLLLPEIEDLLEVLHARGVIPVLWHFP